MKETAKLGGLGPHWAVPRFEGLRGDSTRIYETGHQNGGETGGLEELLASRLGRGHRAQGVATLGRGVRRFLGWCGEAGEDPRQVGLVQLKAWRRDLVGAGLKAGSVAGLLWAAGVYLRFLEDRGERPRGLGGRLTRLRRPSPLPRHLLKESSLEAVLTRLADWPQEPRLRARQLGLRAQVLAELLYATGLRIAEAAALEPSDLDLEGRTVRVRQGKGGRERTACLSDYAAALLKAYLVVRPWILHRGFARRQSLFGASEVNLSQFINRHLARACRAVGVASVTAHSLRHMAGWHLLRAGAGLRVIQALLGHAQIKSTELYARVDSDSLRSVLDACHPRSDLAEETDALDPSLRAV